VCTCLDSQCGFVSRLHCQLVAVQQLGSIDGPYALHITMAIKCITVGVSIQN